MMLTATLTKAGPCVLTEDKQLQRVIIRLTVTHSVR